MSRVLPDPQIVHLRAMRAGDIAVAVPSTVTVGVAKSAAPSPEGQKSVTLSAATQTLETLAGTPSITLAVDGSFPVLTSVDSTSVSKDSFISVGLNGAGSFPEIFFELVTLSGTPERDLLTGGTFPALTVTHGTSVV